MYDKEQFARSATEFCLSVGLGTETTTLGDAAERYILSRQEDELTLIGCVYRHHQTDSASTIVMDSVINRIEERAKEYGAKPALAVVAVPQKDLSKLMVIIADIEVMRRYAEEGGVNGVFKRAETKPAIRVTYSSRTIDALRVMPGVKLFEFCEIKTMLRS